MFINYEKIADIVIDKFINKNRNDIVKGVAEIIADKLVGDKEYIDYVRRNLYIETLQVDPCTGYHRSYTQDMNYYVGNEVASRLVNDVYDLNKAEVLKEVSSQGILQLLQEKLQESAKQHVLDYISKPMVTK